MGDDLVKTVKISKNGRFYFSRNFDEEKIESLLDNVRLQYIIIQEIPVLPALRSDIKKVIRRQAIHGTAALEGNPLSEEEVGEILDRTDNLKSIEKKYREIENLDLADNLLKQNFTKEGPPYLLKEEDILFFHKTIVEGIEEEKTRPGQYRINKVSVGDKEHGGTYVPPKTKKDIVLLMNEFIKFINDEKMLSLDPVVRAAIAHYHLGRIHPFEDGNGRVARYIEALLMQTAGLKYFPVNLFDFYNKYLDEYYWAFSLAGKNKEKDLTPYISFIVTVISETLTELSNKIQLSIRTLIFKELIKGLRANRDITLRQHDFIELLLNSEKEKVTNIANTAPFNILYRDVVPRTLARDLKKLQGLNLIHVSEEKEVSINMSVLDFE